VVSDFGFRLPVRLFNFIHDARESRVYKSTIRGPLDPSNSFPSVDLRGPGKLVRPAVMHSQWI